MKVNDACAMCVKRFIFRRNAFFNVSDEFCEEDILLKGIYNKFCDSIRNLEIVLDKYNNLSVNGKVNKFDIINEIIIGIQSIGFVYGMYRETLLNEMLKAYMVRFESAENLDLLNMYYTRIIKSFVYIIYCL